MKNKFSENSYKKVIDAQKRGREKHKQNKIIRMLDYDKNPVLCKLCTNPISYEKRKNKFCSSSCSVSYNNKGIRRYGNSIESYYRDCQNCGTCIKNKTGYKFCSLTCNAEYNWKILKIDVEKYQGFKGCYYEHRRVIRRYLLETKGYKCEICGLSEWMADKIPLVADHINGKSDDNRLVNLRLICCNCDAQTPTYKNKNRGNGRAYRRKRYAEGKSY